MSRRRKRGRCFACGQSAESARSGTRKNGSRWHLCQQCVDAFKGERDLERATVDFLRAKGAL